MTHDRIRMALLPFLLALAACTPRGDPSIGGRGFRDDFDRAQLGEHWRSTGGTWRIEDGQLAVQGARNHPLWLERKLPRDVRIELDATSLSPEGDIKVEVFGDGRSHATSASYTATSYVVIFGGWNNSLNVLARMDEHGDDRVVGEALRVQPNRRYHLKIERRGSLLSVFVDGRKIMEMNDPEPLHGRGHDHFAFNNWEAQLRFDNLEITPL